MTAIRGGGNRPIDSSLVQPTAAEAAQAVSRQAGQVAGVRTKVQGPGSVTPGDQKPLEEAERSNRGKLSTADAERLVSQAGLAGKMRRRKDLDGDDGGSGQPILPYEDVEAIEQEVAEGGGGQLPKIPMALHQGLLRQWLAGLDKGGKAVDLHEMIGQLIGEIAKGGGGVADADLVLLQQLAQAAPQQAPGMAMAQQSLAEWFAVDTSALPLGQQLAAVALAVTGNGDCLQQTGEGIEPEAFAQGVAKVVEEGQQALDSGETMQDGVHKQLALHRTFVVRR